MMKVNQQKMSYTAPRMEATGFKAEQGYAGSEQPTKSFSIIVNSGSL